MSSSTSSGSDAGLSRSMIVWRSATRTMRSAAVVLQPHAVLQRAEVVAQVQRAVRAVAGQDATGFGMGEMVVLFGSAGARRARVAIRYQRPLARAAGRHGCVSRAALEQPPPARACARLMRKCRSGGHTAGVRLRRDPRGGDVLLAAIAGGVVAILLSAGGAEARRDGGHDAGAAARDDRRRRHHPGPPRLAAPPRVETGTRAAGTARRRGGAAPTSWMRCGAAGWRVTAAARQLPVLRRAPRPAGHALWWAAAARREAFMLGMVAARDSRAVRGSPDARMPDRARDFAATRGGSRARASRDLPEDQRQGAQRAGGAGRPCSSSTIGLPGTGRHEDARRRGCASWRCSSRLWRGGTSAPPDG